MDGKSSNSLATFLSLHIRTETQHNYTMPSNKDRLYVALYARAGAAKMPGGEDEYHWGLVIGPKIEGETEQGMRYHAKEVMTGPGQSTWVFEEKSISLLATSMLLVRVMVAKVENRERLVDVLRKVPIRQGQKDWNCVSWAREALEAAGADGMGKGKGRVLGTSRTEWQAVRDAVMWYVGSKKEQHRWDGTAGFDTKYAATYDLLDKKEIIP
ncbi:hypothetical protein DL98DRAFT_59174 [Cadophora sp. DSE1049]|nr:hypothetical protein DL98DRAFT_59174 [Cadophora sp. DSE1049]